MTAPSLSEDRAWCEATLPRVSRTFVLNIRLLADPLREAVSVGYLLCRTADTLEDAWPGTAAEIQSRFGLLLQAIAGEEAAAGTLAAAAAGAPANGAAELEIVAGFPRAWRVWRALPGADRERIAECLRTMAPGMCRYAARAAARPPGTPYLDSEAELHDYCWVVAGCVGVMLTRLAEAEAGGNAEARARRLELAPVVGEALQLTNILLDWPADVRQGRCHVPADWLAAQGLAPGELTGPARPEVDRLARRLEDLARAALARVPDYVDLVSPRALRYRLFVLMPALWALASLEHARRDPEFPRGRRPRLPRAALWHETVRGLLGHRGAALARLRAAAPRPGA
jgi:farnesyl-diphosphate farnesyltransferase